MRHAKSAALILLTVIAAAALADSLVLKDGTTLEGRVAEQSDRYWIKLTSGESRFVPKSQVQTWTKGNAAAPKADAPAASTPGVPAAPVTSGGAAFTDVKNRAERVDAPLAAVGLWQSFIDNNSNSPDLDSAKKELERWKQMDKEKAEKINGKWVGGEERKKLIEKVQQLLRDADEAEHSNQTIKAVGKLEEAVRLYPNNFRAHFELGYFCLAKSGTGNKKYLDEGIKSLEMAAKLRPNSAAAWSNLAIAYNFRELYEKSVLTAYKAAQIDDSKEVVQNLWNSIMQAPPGMRENNTKVRPIMDEALLLARKRGVEDARQAAWAYVRPSSKEKAPEADDDKNSRPGVIGNGSGFIVSADGYLITNRHVAKEKNCIFMCRFVDGAEKSAKVIAIDDDADIAIMKLKEQKGKPYTFVQLAGDDEPGPGAACSALGYPVADVMNYTMQVTSGTVSSIDPTEPYHVTLTAKITHGNSGGPLVDKYGNVIGVVSAGLTAFTETYGKALSAGQVRKFLAKVTDKVKTKIDPGKPLDKPLDPEEIYKKDSPAVLCIILIRSGESGASGVGESGTDQ